MEKEGYLLDSSVASIAWDSGNPNHEAIRRRLVEIADELLFISSVTLAEVEYGLLTAPHIDILRQEAVRNAMAGYLPSQVLSIDRHTAKEYARIKSVLFMTYSPRNRRGRLTKKRVEDLVERSTGKELGIQENDLWIVAIAVNYHLRFVTRDEGSGMTRIVRAANYAHRTDYWRA